MKVAGGSGGRRRVDLRAVPGTRDLQGPAARDRGQQFLDASGRNDLVMLAANDEGASRAILCLDPFTWCAGRPMPSTRFAERSGTRLAGGATRAPRTS
jgi:hypothetical protein